MKTIKILILLNLGMAAALASATRIGNGNDEVFALQRLQQDNPTLSPSEILIKAFKESVGRIPRFQYDECKEQRQSAKMVVGGQFFGVLLRGNYDQRTSDFNVQIYRRCFDDGPLVGPRNSEADFIISSTTKVLNSTDSGLVKESATGLMLQGFDKGSDHLIEVRQYNNRILIFAMPSKDGACFGLKGDVEGLCYVGYSWVN
jgi:hypothetical protein